MDDEQFDRRLSALARAHNVPPEPPREAMWEEIQRRRRANGRSTGEPRPRSRWIPLAAAAGAILAAGVGIGRLTREPVALPAPTAAAGVTSQGGETAYRIAAAEHLGQAEEFLTLFRTGVGQANEHRLASATARRLLATNRLLLDSPAAADPPTRLLLEDLELVLAGIAQLSPRSPAQDLDLVREGIERGDVLHRLRTAVPAGRAPSQGAL